PELAAALSATGALLSDLSAEYYATFLTTTNDFDFEMVNAILENLELECAQFIDKSAAISTESAIHYAVEARYRDQIWELDVPFGKPRVGDPRDVAELRRAVGRVHDEILAHVDPGSDVEFVTWRTKVECRSRGGPITTPEADVASEGPTERAVYFHGSGRLDT